MSEPVHDLGVRALSERIHAGELSPIELTESLLARVDRLDARLHAFVHVTRDRALAEARAAEQDLRAGRSRGLLHGIPYAVKDLFDVAGVPTGAGTHLLADAVAPRDCTAVDRLAAAGMVLLGKTHTVQLAFGGAGINHDTGTPLNPWFRRPHTPGGSSSGSAVAVAAGLVPVALGTDTGGSVRIPAALCGVTGLKTTVGRVSRAGVHPLSSTLDSVGPIARSAEDCAWVYEALQGADPDGDESTADQVHHDVGSTLDAGVAGLRVGVAETAFWDGVDGEVATAVRAAADVLAGLGARVESIEVPEVGEVMGGAGERHRALMIAAEACSFNRRLLEDHFDALDPIVAHRMRAGFDLAAADYVETLRIWRRAGADLARRMSDVDALVVPTTMIPALPIDVVDATPESYASHNGRYLRNTAIGNMLGLCATTTPCGTTSTGAPIGMMVYAKPFDEAAALRVAHAYEGATDWHRRRPSV
jgi:aspartyl-tRNA(Asn)/glutamyl-tRNA(Gln) amidotransferase subunit A